MTRFFQRGGAWVVVQGVLLAAVILLPVWFRSVWLLPGIVITGMVLIAAGVVVAIAGALALGKNLSPFPKPAERVRLVRHGIYALIRHPLYTSVISLSAGWALVMQSWPALIAASLLIPFLHAKAIHEERWLREKFPEYAAYERRVRRFIPWLY